MPPGHSISQIHLVMLYMDYELIVLIAVWAVDRCNFHIFTKELWWRTSGTSKVSPQTTNQSRRMPSKVQSKSYCFLVSYAGKFSPKLWFQLMIYYLQDDLLLTRWISAIFSPARGVSPWNLRFVFVSAGRHFRNCTSAVEILQSFVRHLSDRILDFVGPNFL